jgi:hypothetical protein
VRVRRATPNWLSAVGHGLPLRLCWHNGRCAPAADLRQHPGGQDRANKRHRNGVGRQLRRPRHLTKLVTYFSTSTMYRRIVFAVFSPSGARSFQTLDWKNAMAASALSHSVIATLMGAGPPSAWKTRRSPWNDHRHRPVPFWLPRYKRAKQSHQQLVRSHRCCRLSAWFARANLASPTRRLRCRSNDNPIKH